MSNANGISIKLQPYNTGIFTDVARFTTFLLLFIFPNELKILQARFVFVK